MLACIERESNRGRSVEHNLHKAQESNARQNAEYTRVQESNTRRKKASLAQDTASNTSTRVEHTRRSAADIHLNPQESNTRRSVKTVEYNAQHSNTRLVGARVNNKSNFYKGSGLDSQKNLVKLPGIRSPIHLWILHPLFDFTTPKTQFIPKMKSFYTMSRERQLWFLFDLPCAFVDNRTISYRLLLRFM